MPSITNMVTALVYLASAASALPVNVARQQTSECATAKQSFLLDYLFSKLKPFLKQITPVRDVSHHHESSIPPKVRFIFTQDKELDEWTCKRISSQTRCKELVDFLFWQGGSLSLASAFVGKSTKETRQPFHHVMSLIQYMEFVRYDVESAMLSLAAEKLEFCTVKKQVLCLLQGS
ncbi:hypothetical protein FACUT_6288 [Fusarium acutatum]|uniref:LAGLIDADG endonuclease n=1 Tax=Fusarium acutatum TaxID=78861 RepID=A0A8H4JTA9_9HYPO|nr:hypothetical protein FACUT_6288 [Fusarium acutatum]